MDEHEERALTYAREMAAALAREDGWVAPGAETLITITLPFASTRALEEYWERGEGAREVGWGKNNSMKNCIRKMREHVRDPGGYCAKRHKAATGEWPAEKGIDS